MITILQKLLAPTVAVLLGGRNNCERTPISLTIRNRVLSALPLVRPGFIIVRMVLAIRSQRIGIKLGCQGVKIEFV